MDEILDILNELELDVDLGLCDTLIDDGYLTSLDIVSIISELSEVFDVTIPAREIVPENFNSASAMYDMIQRLLDE